MTGSQGDIDNLYSRHLTNILEAKTEGLDVDIDVLRGGITDPVTWAQEYECLFMDEATAFLTYDMIDAVEHDLAGLPDRSGPGPFYLGADIGRRGDLTVYWVLEQAQDVLWTREIAVLDRQTFAEQDRELDRLFRQYQPRRLCMDQGGLGEKMVEDAKSRYGRTRVEGVLFTGPVKQDLAMGLRREVEDRTLRVPADRVIREDLHSVRRCVTAAGNIRFDAQRRDGGHADRFWALALAVHASREPSAPPQILSQRTPAVSSRLEGW